MSGAAYGGQRVDCGKHVKVLVLGKPVLGDDYRLLNGSHSFFGILDVALNERRVAGGTRELRHALLQLVSFTYSVARGVGVQFGTTVH